MAESNTIQNTIDHIVQVLAEEHKGPLRQIEQTVRLCGAEQAMAWLAETLAIESGEGLMTADGQRRRTPGGVFFRIVRDQLEQREEQEKLRAIFGHGATNPDPTLRQASWSERPALITEAGTEIGKAISVKVTLIGRPGKVVERQNFTLMMLKHNGSLPNLPRGIPAPAQVPPTTYIVYIASKQWNKVKDALAQSDSTLIVDGAQFYDPEYGAIAVFATNVKVQPQQTEQTEKTDKPDPSSA